MKLRTVLFLALFGLSLSAKADPTFNYYNLKTCRVWIPSNTGRGFVCSSSPTTASVPEVQSLHSVLVDYEKRIKALEDEIKALKEKN